MTLEDRANLYRLIYDSVTIVGTMFKVTQGDKAAILDINGNEFISGDLDSLKTCDSFILLRNSGDTWSILNTLTGKRIKTKLYMYWDEDFRCVGSGLLGVKVDHMEYKLYDIYLNEILNSIRMFSGYSKNGKCIINYRLEYYSFGKFE